MSTANTVTTAGTASGTTPARRPGWLRQHRSWALIAAAVVAATALAVAQGSGTKYDAPLDPGNAGPSGARALAQVLADQGIDVQIVRDAAAFTDTTVDSRTTVLVTSTQDLGTSTARQVVARSTGADLVLAEPGFGIPELFGSEDGTGYSRTRTVEAGCPDPLLRGLRAETREGTLFPATDGACFADGPGALLTAPRPGVRFLGAADVLSNEQITRADNAAIALRLLGQRSRLVWYVPDPADLTGDDGVSLGSLLPGWVRPGLVIGTVSVLALMVWRGRRLGPLASEPLPVTVAAIETTLSRGRLYRKADDRGYAADALRRSARAEIGAHLMLPRRSADDVDLLVRMLAAHTPTEPGRIRALLGPGGPVPQSDRDLIALANDLAELSREVRRP
ncbi:MAG: DUF4350 domain-containing protein [Propionibacteriales bacterium]|nr:DUF4350 domain-containing protein [Propionibacteriales bacterium]